MCQNLEVECVDKASPSFNGQMALNVCVPVHFDTRPLHRIKLLLLYDIKQYK